MGMLLAPASETKNMLCFQNIRKNSQIQGGNERHMATIVCLFIFGMMEQFHNLKFLIKNEKSFYKL